MSKARGFLDLSDPFFAPRSVRVSVVTVCLAWGLIELLAGATLWAVLFLALGAFCGWKFATIDYASRSGD